VALCGLLLAASRTDAASIAGLRSVTLGSRLVVVHALPTPLKETQVTGSDRGPSGLPDARFRWIGGDEVRIEQKKRASAKGRWRARAVPNCSAGGLESVMR